MALKLLLGSRPDAVGRAHAAGIVHRDLKPATDRLTEEVVAASLDSRSLARGVAESRNEELVLRFETLLCLAVAAHPSSRPFLAGSSEADLSDRLFKEGRRLREALGDPARDPNLKFPFTGEIGEAWGEADFEWSRTGKARGPET